MKKTILLFDTANFWAVNWYYPVALLVATTGVIIAYKNFKKKPTPAKEGNNSTATSNNNIPISITNNFTPTENKPETISDFTSNDENLKATTKILSTRILVSYPVFSETIL